MTTLYNLRHSTDNNFTITKFVDGEVESSYELAANLRECACPAGHRPSCRHRQMAPMMLASGIIDTHYFWDYDLNRAVDFNGTLKSNFDAMEELADRAIGATIEDFEREHGIAAVAEGPPSKAAFDLTATEIDQRNANLPPLKDPITEHLVERIHAKVVAANRKTFIIPDGHEAVRDAEGRATGELVAKPWRRL